MGGRAKVERLKMKRKKGALLMSTETFLNPSEIRGESPFESQVILSKTTAVVDVMLNVSCLGENGSHRLV